MDLMPNPSLEATAHGQRLMSNVGGGVSTKGHKQGNKRGHSEFLRVTMRDLLEETSMSIYILP